MGVLPDDSRPKHVAAAELLRRQRRQLLRPAPEPQAQIRCLDDYDTALGLDTHRDGPDLDTGPGNGTVA